MTRIFANGVQVAGDGAALIKDPDLEAAVDAFWRTRALFGQTPEDQGPFLPAPIREDFGDPLAWLMWLGAHEDRAAIREFAVPDPDLEATIVTVRDAMSERWTPAKMPPAAPLQSMMIEERWPEWTCACEGPGLGGASICRGEDATGICACRCHFPASWCEPVHHPDRCPCKALSAPLTRERCACGCHAGDNGK